MTEIWTTRPWRFRSPVWLQVDANQHTKRLSVMLQQDRLNIAHGARVVCEPEVLQVDAKFKSQLGKTRIP